MEDAEEVVENELINDKITLKSNILKVGHHGSESSTTEPFLKAVSLQYAVISVGEDNRYGHPSPAVINRLKRHNIKIYRTDKQGTIIADSDGSKIKFNKKELDLDKERVQKTLWIYLVGNWLVKQGDRNICFLKEQKFQMVSRLKL